MTVPDTRFFFSVISFDVEQTFAISTAAAIVFKDTTRIVCATVVEDLELLLRLVAYVLSASLVLLVHRMEHAGNVVARPATTWHGFCVLRTPIHKVFAVPADAVDARRVLACSLPNVDLLCSMLACVWSMIDGKRALLCGYVFVDKECAFAPRGVVLVFITVVTPSTPCRRTACAGMRMRFCGQGVRFRSPWCGAEICGDPTDAVPGQVVDMPVIVRTVVQMCRKLWKRFTVAVPG